MGHLLDAESSVEQDAAVEQSRTQERRSGGVQLAVVVSLSAERCPEAVRFGTLVDQLQVRVRRDDSHDVGGHLLLQVGSSNAVPDVGAGRGFQDEDVVRGERPGDFVELLRTDIVGAGSADAEQARSVDVVRVVIVHVLEAGGVTTGEVDHFALEDLQEVARFVTLGNANLHGFAVEFVVQADRVHGGGSFLIG